jgi:SAM-dependent methyltransferase
MTFQENYARCYNLIYQGKDYIGEVNYILSFLNEHHPNLESILELGSGTGSHALILAEKGYLVDGIDLSSEMLAIANERCQNLSKDVEQRVNFIQGDVRTIRTQKKYDAVISLFHVMSYQVSNEDLHAAFETAKLHLKPGGVLLFDCWYGPGVLSDLPATRIKRMEDEYISLIRIAEPIIFPHNNLVQVNYEFFIDNKKTSEKENFRETHNMRYLFQPEIKMLFETHQLNFLECFKELNADELSLNSWSVYFIAKS